MSGPRPTTAAGKGVISISITNTPNPGGSGDHDDTKVLRLSDIILIAAEAYYNAGDFTNANKYLNMVAMQRDPAFAGWADDSGTRRVLEDILIERRKELAFEGSRFWDLVRLGRSWIKIKNQSPATSVAVAPGNNALVFPVPVTELNCKPEYLAESGLLEQRRATKTNYKPTSIEHGPV